MKKKISRTIPIAIGIVLASFVASTGIPVKADTTGLIASAENNAALTVTVSDTSADFGTNLDPKGTDSNSPDVVNDYQGSSGNQGTYYGVGFKLGCGQ